MTGHVEVKTKRYAPGFGDWERLEQRDIVIRLESVEYVEPMSWDDVEIGEEKIGTYNFYRVKMKSGKEFDLEQHPFKVEVLSRGKDE